MSISRALIYLIPAMITISYVILVFITAHLKISNLSLIKKPVILKSKKLVILQELFFRKKWLIACEIEFEREEEIIIDVPNERKLLSKLVIHSPSRPSISKTDYVFVDGIIMGLFDKLYFLNTPRNVLENEIKGHAEKIIYDNQKTVRGVLFALPGEGVESGGGEYRFTISKHGANRFEIVMESRQE